MRFGNLYLAAAVLLGGLALPAPAHAWTAEDVAVSTGGVSYNPNS